MQTPQPRSTQSTPRWVRAAGCEQQAGWVVWLEEGGVSRLPARLPACPPARPPACLPACERSRAVEDSWRCSVFERTPALAALPTSPIPSTHLRSPPFACPAAPLLPAVLSQYSLNGGVVVQVTGIMQRPGAAKRPFVQTFFLAVQEKGYYVLNDIFRCAALCMLWRACCVCVLVWPVHAAVCCA